MRAWIVSVLENARIATAGTAINVRSGSGKVYKFGWGKPAGLITK